MRETARPRRSSAWSQGGGEKLEIIFPSDEEKAVSKAMEQMLLSRGSANQTITKISTGLHCRLRKEPSEDALCRELTCFA
jgi:hypothetical protein